MMGGAAAGDQAMASARELLAHTGAKAKGERRKRPQTAQKSQK
jgi:hypothetical protein